MSTSTPSSDHARSTAACTPERVRAEGARLIQAARRLDPQLGAAHLADELDDALGQPP